MMMMMMEGRVEVPENISRYDRSIYHFLSRSFSQRIAVSQIIYFNILDIVAIFNVYFLVKASCTLGASW